MKTIFRFKSNSVLIGIAFTLSLLAGCANTSSSPELNVSGLKRLESFTQAAQGSGEAGRKLRFEAIKESALSIGSQSGLAWRSRRLNELTLQYQDQLDGIFNFEPLILDHHVVSPVLMEADQSINLDSQTTLRLSGKIYEIIKQAQFVTTSPNWRDYLILYYDYPEPPNNSLLPKTAKEREIWKYYIDQGWLEGIKQADDIYLNQVAKLQRDFLGMILYRRLLAAHMVSKPFVAQTNLGVTSDKAHTQLYIDDRVLRITALPELNVNTKEWKPVVATQTS